ncbi:Putative beta-lactamase HcpC precursor [Thalassovita gelatinovora]|uniref:Putative beta-lactamase HcpC n=1 Tax=Thalassovita gelatinovora TaxID=53501 RepID=A0A0N7LUG9_THAGE|nr:SEL1-like repeat protein [Thalassovita gelatinovora]QIZ80946.1 SEL1-like repeat protein [Thalassovita gelatinovora]CUH63466.1 Putative beta-lactamase HcpC precursor [Thalassovita gelatinovora]SEQ67410.1 TPR repeat [Thalassovita gelatinovora]
MKPQRSLALALIAILLATGAGAQSAPDWANAPIDKLQQSAQSGAAEAQFALAMRYHNGRGVLQNFSRAVDLLQQAADQGHAGAMNRLGQYYFSGLGVSRDAALAQKWLASAAEKGTPQYLYDYASALENGLDGSADPAKAAEFYARAAEQGHDDAIVSLGVLYQNGLGVERDLTRARQLYEGPASRGHARAMNNLGLLYVRGNGIEQDYERAVKLFSGAVDQGLSVAMTNLGVMYENGFGVEVNEALATELYRRGGRGDAAQKQALQPVYDRRLAPPDTTEAGLNILRQAVQAGDPVARFQMAWLLLHKSDPTIKDRYQAAGLLQQAAEQGLAPAMMNLGILYYEGAGVPQDYVLGQMWLILAGTAGMPDAISVSSALSERMTSGQINEAQQLAANKSNLQ